MSSPRPSSRSPRSGPDPRLNSVGLDEHALAEVLDRFDCPTSAATSSQRNYRRFAFRHASITLDIVQPSGEPHRVRVASRNISRFGMSLVHSAYVHAGTRCVVSLPRKEGGPLAIPGEVARCGHRLGRIHEIGLKFDAAVDLRDLLRPDPFGEWCSLERVNPSDLRGTIVHAERCEREQGIVRHLLRQTALSIRTASTAAEAVAASQGADLILADDETVGGAATLRRELEQSGSPVALIVVTAATDAAERAKVAETHADGFLAQPLEQGLLLRALGEFLLLGVEQTAPLELPPPSPEALDHAIKELRRHAQVLERAAQCGDAAAAREVCRHIAQASQLAALAQLSQAALTLARGTGKLTPEPMAELCREIASLPQSDRKAA